MLNPMRIVIIMALRIILVSYTMLNSIRIVIITSLLRGSRCPKFYKNCHYYVPFITSHGKGDRDVLGGVLAESPRAFGEEHHAQGGGHSKRGHRDPGDTERGVVLLQARRPR